MGASGGDRVFAFVMVTLVEVKPGEATVKEIEPG
jgi:hypothetical protein